MTATARPISFGAIILLIARLAWRTSANAPAVNTSSRKNGWSSVELYLGTTDCREVERRIENGDAHAKLIYDAMALNVAKYIAKLAPGICGKVDAILLTGGITYSDYIDEEIRRRVSFIAPVTVYPGEDEMQSLAFGCLRVLRGEEKARTYVRVE